MSDKLSETIGMFFDAFVVEDASSEIVVEMPEEETSSIDLIEEQGEKN